MARFIKAFIGSIFRLFFAILVCSGFIAMVAIPAVGRVAAAPGCEGTVQSQTQNFSQPNGEFGQTVQYQCVAEDGTATPISFFDLLMQVGIWYVAFMVVVAWPLLFAWSFWRAGQSSGMPRTVYITTRPS